MRPYLTAARLSRSSLATAMEEAKSFLPASVLKQHFIASKHSPAAWASVEAWYLSYGERDQQVLDTITDLVLMSEALSCLGSVVTEPTTTGSLKLAKVKRLG